MELKNESRKVKTQYRAHVLNILRTSTNTTAHTKIKTHLQIGSIALAHPVIIVVVMEVIRCQRCLRKRALKAKLYRSLQRANTEIDILKSNIYLRVRVPFQSDDTIRVRNSKITFRQSVCYVGIVNFALLTRGHTRKAEKINDTVNQHFPHRIFLAFLSPLIACEDRKEIK